MVATFMDRRLTPDVEIEGRIFGVDEAGRGAMAGPLAVAAVEFPWPWLEPSNDLLRQSVRDSKVLSASIRNHLCQIITETCKYACVMIDSTWIDDHGIQAAEAEGLNRVVEELATGATDSGWHAFNWPDMVICDGTEQTWNSVEFNPIALFKGVNLRFMVHGDRHVPAISAASIVAKTFRDDYMRKILHLQYPQYRFDLHVGYVTPLHLAKLDEFGSCPIHRHSFRPVGERDARDR